MIEKLDAFIRKYYRNQLLKGLIIGTGGMAATFVLVSLLEFLGHFSTTVRTVLFFSFLLFSTFVLIKFVLVPLSKLYRMGKVIDYTEASKIIGNHFANISDKLLNTIQLQENALSQKDNALLLASIEARTEELRPVPFTNAINLRENLKYLRYAAIPVGTLLVVFLVSPGFTDSTKRLVLYNTYFEKEAPFVFELVNKDLTAIQNEDFEIGVSTKGDVAPAEAYIVVGGNRFKMKHGDQPDFEYTLKNLTTTTTVYFESGEVRSREFTVNVLAKPTLLDFKATLNYPDYTGLKDEELKNTTDFTLPVGTRVVWNIQTRNTDQLKLYSGKESMPVERTSEGFRFARQFLHNALISVKPSNSEVGEADTARFSVQVVPDNYPTIEYDEKADSLSSKLIYMMGEITDDYGFRNLYFKYRFKESEQKSKVDGEFKSIRLPIDPNLSKQRFYHLWDLNAIDLDPSDKVEYFFEIWDNDGVNGSKYTRTSARVYAAPSVKEINEETEKKTEEIKKDIKEAGKQIENIEKSIEDLKKKLTEKPNLSWEDKQKVKELLQQHENLQNRLENMVEQNKEKNTRESEFKKLDEEIAEKQRQIEELFEEVVNDEMKELMQKIQELMEQNNKEELQKALQELELNDKELQKQMDRMLEQLKKLQLEKKVNETIEKLNELARDQEELSKKSLDKDEDKEELVKEQEELQKELEDAKEDLKEINEKNQGLEKPLNMETPDQQLKNAGQKQQEGKEQLEKNQRQKSSGSQGDAAEEMNKAAKQLQQSLDAAQQQRKMEDYNTLRMILENLLQVSKDQEALMERFGEIREYSPKYVELGQAQKKIRDDTRVIEDSLFALSKRNAQLEHFINKEIGLVNAHISQSIEHIGERRTREVVSHQQYSMTSLNNLALMLSNSLEQMQKQMRNNMPGEGQCNNPGGNNKKPGMEGIRKMQEELNKQLKELQDGMKEGGEKPGSEGFAKAAAQQAAIRKRLQDLQRQLEKEGKARSLGDINKTRELMDDIEKDLYNKRLSPDVLKKQQEILTRLLEHEKAERKQEQEERRESNEGRQIQRDVPPAVEEYLKQQEKEQELLKTLPPGLTPYYKNKVREYFRSNGKL